MNQTIANKYIPQQLLHFIAGRRCCQEFSCTFRTSDHTIFIDCARSLGIRHQYIISSSNQGFVKVFKLSCKHYLEEPKMLTLTESTRMDMLALLTRDNFLGKEELLMYVNSAKIPPVYLALAPLSSPMPRTKTEMHSQILREISGQLYYKDILQALYANRVIVVNADLATDTIQLFPIILFEDAVSKCSNLEIICIERENILALHNGQRLANLLGESVGETVGIQLPHQSNISSGSHVVYTTAQYFLRTLFHKDSRKLQHISHFVLNDVHLHAPYTDILLYELKQALCSNQNIRIILLSQNYDLDQNIAFLGEGVLLNLEKRCLAGYRVSYLEDLQSSLAAAGIQHGPQIYKNKHQLFRNKSNRNEQINKCLEVYEELGTDSALYPFLYAVNYDLVPVNYQHSLSGKTAILIAAQLSNVSHLRLLLYMAGNPYIADERQENAITVAFQRGNAECIDILNNYSAHGFIVKNARPEFVDYDLIISIMYLLFSKPDFSAGNILIVLPTYYHIVKLNYMLLSHFLSGYLRAFSIHLLHNELDKEYLDALISAPAENIKVVLATDIVESLVLPISFKYLIDTACSKRTWYDGTCNSTEDRYEWVAKDSLLRRHLLLHGEAAASDSHCFRLISKDTFQLLCDTSKPLIQTMHLDKVCLTVKLLSPNTIIGEYLNYIMEPPPLINVHQTVQFLKKIDVLDKSEDVTWLGCRLVDLPVPCQLGRTLIFGILLQCLDPILTIVSSLCTADPLCIPFSEDLDGLWHKFTIYIQNRIKNERNRLAEDQFSDHFIYVRMFQEWQNLQKNEKSLYLTDEHEFMLTGLMEQLTSTRAQLLSALRAANLIYNQGQLSIQNLNTKSANWALVKAALAGGMYPNICAVDPNKNSLKSAHSVNLHLHPNTVLRGFLEPLTVSAQKVSTQWIVCNRQKNNVKQATAVVPLAVAMFAGASKLGTNHISKAQTSPNSSNMNFLIDEWIWLIVPKSEFELVIKTRQQFFKLYKFYLEHCSDLKMWRCDSTMAIHFHQLLDTLGVVFQNEDTAAGFRMCPQIGLRPVLQQRNLYLLNINSYFTWNQHRNDKTSSELGSFLIERQYFMLFTERNAGSFYQQSDAAYIESVIGKFARPIDSPSRHIYVILYSKNPDIMLSISRAKIQNDDFILMEYYRNSIPISEIIEACASLNVQAPNFDGRLLSSLIDKRVGNLIMDLFAFRNHWIHN